MPLKERILAALAASLLIGLVYAVIKLIEWLT